MVLGILAPVSSKRLAGSCGIQDQYCEKIDQKYRYIFAFLTLKINNSSLKNAVNNYAITARLGLREAKNANTAHPKRNVLWRNVLSGNSTRKKNRVHGKLAKLASYSIYRMI